MEQPGTTINEIIQIKKSAVKISGQEKGAGNSVTNPFH